MPRPERPIDPAAGPIQAFAADLRKLRTAAGTPKYLQMARVTGRSRTALSEAAGGDHLPSWDTVAAFVLACGGNVGEWRMRWEDVRDQVRPPDQLNPDPAEPTATLDPPVPDPAAVPEPAVVCEPGESVPARSPIRLGRRTLILVMAVGIVVASGGYWVARGAGRSSGHSAVTSVAITVHNKVAIGSTGLVEDSTPAYLSTEAVPRCAARGCKVPGTEVWSDVILVARCWTRGETVTNRDLTSEGIEQNPAGVTSDLWYEIVLHDGRTGYLSEIYVDANHRGGMGLPECAVR